MQVLVEKSWEQRICPFVLIQVKILTWEIQQCIGQLTLITHLLPIWNKKVGTSRLKDTPILITKGHIPPAIIIITVIIENKNHSIKDLPPLRDNHKQHPHSIFNISKRTILMDNIASQAIAISLSQEVIHIRQGKLDSQMRWNNQEEEEAIILNSMANIGTSHLA